MARLRFRRKPKVGSVRKRRTMPQPPEATGLTGAARRVNRVVAAMVLFGAFGTVALAVALTPGAQQSPSVANASQGTPVSEAATEPAVIEVAARPEPVIAAPPPPRAVKSDRLFGTSAERTAKGDLDVAALPLRTSASRERGTRDFALATQEPAFEASGRGPHPDLDADRENIEFGLSEPPEPADTSDDAGSESGDEAIDEAVVQATAAATEQAAEEAIDEAVEEAVEEPEPEVAVATRTTTVTTDVNMRTRPDNGASVVHVVRRDREVEVIGCNYWCEVIHDGKRGFIYKGFVRGS